MPKVILYVFFWIILVLMDLSVNDDVSELQQGSRNECGFYVAYHMIRLAVNFKNLKGAKVSLCQI